MLLIVWIAVAVLVLAVLGVLTYSLLGAAGRLARELRGLQGEVAPLLADAQATAARATEQRAERAANGG